jgi:hypothetical protein
MCCKAVALASAISAPNPTLFPFAPCSVWNMLCMTSLMLRWVLGECAEGCSIPASSIVYCFKASVANLLCIAGNAVRITPCLLMMSKHCGLCWHWYLHPQVCLNCSSRTLRMVADVFFYALKSVLYPLQPLYDRCVSATMCCGGACSSSLSQLLCIV